jgi:uncharacterized membrane protein
MLGGGRLIRFVMSAAGSILCLLMQSAAKFFPCSQSRFIGARDNEFKSSWIC